LGKKPQDKAAATVAKESRTAAPRREETVARPDEKKAPATEARTDATVKEGTE
jgi:hypothetical protein